MAASFDRQQGAKHILSPRWKRRLRRFFIGSAIALPLLMVALWIAVHTFPGLGPVLSDGLRSVLGTERVSRLQDFVYSVQDRFNRWYREGEAPKAHWEVPTAAPAPEPTPSSSASASAAPAKPKLPPYARPNIGPMLKQLAAKGDGVWVPIEDPRRVGAAPLMLKTLLHPDGKRPWAELFVVALDLRQIDLHFVAGSLEPKSRTTEARAYKRTGIIPAGHRDILVAAFNGGFKWEHGHWGARVDGVTLVPGRKHGCDIIKRKDGSLFIEMHKDLTFDPDKETWWRQTPPCMYRKGKRHGALWHAETTAWGAALGGDAVIRRSAVGLDAARTTLFVSVSNHTTAQAMANGMHHAGAVDVAQLDVNWSFPKFLIFERGAHGSPAPRSLFKGFKIAAGEYLKEPSVRDFFYVVRKAPAE